MQVGRRSFLTMAGGVAAGLVIRPQLASADPKAGEGGVTALVARVGLITGDADPARSTLGEFGTDTRAAVDYQYRSFGFDFGAPTTANAIQIVNRAVSHGLTSRDFTVWTSPDNATWTKVRGSRIVDLGAAVWVLFPAVTGPYLKVHCTREYTDVNRCTFVVDSLQRDFVAHHLDLPALIAGNGGVWPYAAELTVINPTADILRDQAAYLTWDDLQMTALLANRRLEADLRDVRFADARGEYLHAYADADGIHIRIPSIAAGEQQTIRMYSGNGEATDTVHADTQALQVEYGQRTLTRHPSAVPVGGDWGHDAKVTRLGSGVIMLAAGTTSAALGARYSTNEGRTFGDIETLIAKPAGRSRISMGSCYVDPTTGMTLLFYYTLGATSGSDWMSEANHSCHCMVARADSYDERGRPIFTSAQRLRPIARNLGMPSSWALTYCNPIRTPTGALLVPVSHVVEHEAPTFVVSVFRSTDNGVTWVQNEKSLDVPGSGFEVGVSESAIQVLADGTILIIARQQGPSRHYFMRAISRDDGLTWQPVTDSDILASNTMPWMSRDRDGHLVLGWSGHNAQNQASYHRNNLTISWSDDEGGTFNGYHDMLGATSHTVPGSIGGHRNYMRVMESDSTPSGARDQLLSWSTWDFIYPTGGPHTMLVEDYEDYSQLSHGALDLVLFRDPACVPWGSELGYSRWWRITGHGALAPAAGSRPQRSAVRLTGTREQYVGASRIFPAIRKGSVKFLIKPTAVGAGVRLLLQEGWSNKVNARGTVASLQIAPGSRLLATQDDTFGDTHSFGYCSDPTPATGNLAEIGANTNFALDYRHRSVGVDYGKPTPITRLTLVDSTSTSAGRTGSRLTALDLTVWVSDTNASDWRQVTDWTVQGDGSYFALAGPAVTARYIKVHQPYADDSFTFVNALDQILRPEPAPPGQQQFDPVGSVVLDSTRWHVLEFAVDTDAGQVRLSVDGASVASLEQVHPAEAVTHFLILGEGGDTGVDVSIDELLVRDLSQGAPRVTKVTPSKPI